jgi:hypothetical protein
LRETHQALAQGPATRRDLFRRAILDTD